ncbi:MAG: hypothetical protein V4515_00730 [Chloroflexota bacterium]
MPAAAAGLCSIALHGNFHIVANKFADEVGATYFDLVRGDLTVRNLDVCAGSGNGSTYVLAANIETAVGQVVQIGYGQISGFTGRRFYYALGSVTAIEWPNSSYLPTLGDRYRFSITRFVEPGGLQDTIVTIQNLDHPSTSTVTRSGWYSALNHAWWGAETEDSASAHGVPAGQANQNVAYMGYSPNTSGAIYYRSGMTCGDIFKDFTWDGSNGAACSGTRHGHIGTWVYGGDELAPETH